MFAVILLRSGRVGSISIGLTSGFGGIHVGAGVPGVGFVVNASPQ